MLKNRNPFHVLNPCAMDKENTKNIVYADCERKKWIDGPILCSVYIYASLHEWLSR